MQVAVDKPDIVLPFRRGGETGKQECHEVQREMPSPAPGEE